MNGKLSKDCMYSRCHNFSLVDQCIVIQVMGIFCMVPGYSNRVKQNGISFHRLPIKDSTRLQKRLNNMKLKSPSNLKYASYLGGVLLKIVMNET